MLKRKEEKKAQELVELGSIYLKDGAYQKAKGSFVEAKSIYESQPGYSLEVAKINKKLGAINAAINKARGVAMRRMSSKFSSINTVSERMSKPSTSRLSAHDGSVNGEVSVNEAPFCKQDERARASDACQKSKRRSNIGSPSDVSVASNTIDALLKNKDCSVSRDLLNDKVTKMMRELTKSQSQSESQLSQKTDNKPEACLSDSIDGSTNEKVTKISLKPEGCLDNTSTSPGFNTSVSIPKSKRSNTFTKRSPSTGLNTSTSVPELKRSNTLTKRSPNSEEDERTNDAGRSESIDPFLQFDSYATDISDFNSPSANMDSVQQSKCSIPPRKGER